MEDPCCSATRDAGLRLLTQFGTAGARRKFTARSAHCIFGEPTSTMKKLLLLVGWSAMPESTIEHLERQIMVIKAYFHLRESTAVVCREAASNCRHVSASRRFLLAHHFLRLTYKGCMVGRSSCTDPSFRARRPLSVPGPWLATGLSVKA